MAGPLLALQNQGASNGGCAPPQPSLFAPPRFQLGGIRFLVLCQALARPLCVMYHVYWRWPRDGNHYRGMLVVLKSS